MYVCFCVLSVSVRVCYVCAVSKDDFVIKFSIFIKRGFRVLISICVLLCLADFDFGLMGSKICMNASCKATNTHEWKRGWPLRSGGFADLCHKCG